MGSLGQGSMGQMVLESGSSEASGEEMISVSSLSTLLFMCRRKSPLGLICL